MISENVSRYENVVVRNHKEIGINNYGLDYLVKIEQELERYKNIVDELKKEKSKKYDYVREVRTFNNNISKKDLEKFPILKQYQGKDISYIVYESIDIL